MGYRLHGLLSPSYACARVVGYRCMRTVVRGKTSYTAWRGSLPGERRETSYTAWREAVWLV